MKAYEPLLKDPNFIILLDVVCNIDRSANKWEIRVNYDKAARVIYQMAKGDMRELWMTLLWTSKEMWKDRIIEYNT